MLCFTTKSIIGVRLITVTSFTIVRLFKSRFDTIKSGGWYGPMTGLATP